MDDDDSDDDVETVFENLAQLKPQLSKNSKGEEILEFSGVSPPTRYFIRLTLENFFIFFPVDYQRNVYSTITLLLRVDFLISLIQC